MGASWVEVDSLLRELENIAQFPHADALMPVVRARDTLAEAAMLVSVAALSENPTEERAAQDALARARVFLGEAQNAVARAKEAVQLARSGRGHAQALISQARSLRARDRFKAPAASAVEAVPPASPRPPRVPVPAA
jgi:hypothetical protein